METKTVTVTGMAMRNGTKGQFPVFNFTSEDGHELKGKAVWDKADRVTAEQAMKDGRPVIIEVETTRVEGEQFPKVAIKSVKKVIEGEVAPVVPSVSPTSGVATQVPTAVKPIPATPQAKSTPPLQPKQYIEPRNTYNDGQRYGMLFNNACQLMIHGLIKPDNPLYMQVMATLAVELMPTKPAKVGLVERIAVPDPDGLF